MFKSQQFEPFSIEMGDLENFKNLILIFTLSTIVSIILSLILTDLVLIGILLDYLVTIIGLAVLAYGTMDLSKKYPYLRSGTRVVVLLVLLIFIEVISVIANILPSQINYTSVNILVNDFTILTIIADGIVTLISAYYYTNWFNLLFNEYKPIKSFFYFGIFSGIGSIGFGSGAFLLLREIHSGNAYALTSLSSASILSLISVGSLMVILGEIFYIVAGFKFYYRVNDRTLGKNPLNPYQAPYYTENQQNRFLNQKQYSSNVNQQPAESDLYDPDPSSRNIAFENILKPNNCINCGCTLEPEAIFCQYCGQMIR